MPFQIIQNDLVKMQVDAIVNTTNPKPAVGYGVDFGIHQAAGPELLPARKALGVLPIGGAGVTNGYQLPAKHILHTVCPVWDGGTKGEVKLLRKAYSTCLQLAADIGCESIAFPLMSAGNHGFPKEIALQVATETIRDFLLSHEMTVYLVVFSKSAVALSEALVESVESYIDENYIHEKKLQEYGYGDKCNVRYEQVCETLQYQRRRYIEEEECMPIEARAPSMAPPSQKTGFFPKAAATPKADPLAELLAQTDEGFSATLLKLIDRSGKKDSEIYKRANIDRRLFSKIRTNPHYQPAKSTVLAFAIALELDLKDTDLLLERAGYALSHASKQDIVVEYFIETQNYDIYTLNSVLFHLDLPTLGNVMK